MSPSITSRDSCQMCPSARLLPPMKPSRSWIWSIKQDIKVVTSILTPWPRIAESLVPPSRCQPRGPCRISHRTMISQRHCRTRPTLAPSTRRHPTETHGWDQPTLSFHLSPHHAGLLRAGPISSEHKAADVPLNRPGLLPDPPPTLLMFPRTARDGLPEIMDRCLLDDPRP